jgi:hypothetical protein
VELNRLPRPLRLPLTNQYNLDFGEIRGRNQKSFTLFDADFRRHGGNRTVAAGDVKDAGAIGQSKKFLLPEIADDSVVVFGFTVAEGRDVALIPESRPLLEAVRFRFYRPVPRVAGRLDYKSVNLQE